MLPVNLPVPAAAALRLPLRWLPDALHAQVFARVFNHLMRGQTLVRRLPALDGKVVRLEITDDDAHDSRDGGGRVVSGTATGGRTSPGARGISGRAAGVPNRIDFAIRGERLDIARGRAPDVTIRGPLAGFWKLATRAEDPDTLFFQRRLAIEGDTETGLHVKNLLDALDYDLEAHVRAVLGERLARPAVALLNRLPAGRRT